MYFTGNAIRRNRRGGIYIHDGADGSIISGNLITDNDNTSGGGWGMGNPPGYGGGLSLNGNSTYTIQNNQILNNRALVSGGVYIKMYHSRLVFSNNVVANNQATQSHGGAYFYSYIDWGGPSTISDNAITGNSAPNYGAGQVYLYLGNTTSNSFVRNTIAANTSSNPNASSLYFEGNGTFNYNNFYDNTATFDVYLGNDNSKPPLNAAYNWWGTADASLIAAKLYDFEDNFAKGRISYSPLLGATYTTPILGPNNPSVSITSQGGTPQDPVFTLALSAATTPA